MTNTNLLKSKMIAAGDERYTDKIAEILNVSKPTANNKLNDKIPFAQNEIIELALYYKMDSNDIVNIFLDDERFMK
jgi:cell division ATPase FtsA